MTNLVETLDAHKPALAAEYEAHVRRIFAAMQANLGHDLANVANDWTYAKPWLNLIRRYARRGPDKAYSIDPDALAVGAAEYATAAVAAWAGKITAKLGDLDAPVVRHLSGTDFEISGSRQGRAIRIEQRMILNLPMPKGRGF